MAITRLLVAAAAGLAWLFAAAAEAKEWTKITIATEGDFAPYMTITQDGKKEGLEVDLAADLCKRMKLECTWVVQKNDVIPGLSAGKYDAIISTMVINSENKDVIYSAPYTVARGTFAISKSGSLADLPDTGKHVLLDDTAAMQAEVATLAKALKGKTVGVFGPFADFANSNFKVGAEVRSYKTRDERDADLTAGRVDVAFDSVSYLTYTAPKKPGGDALKITGPVLINGSLGRGVGVALRPSDPELKTMIDAAIKASITDGTLKTLFIKWFQADWTPPM